MELSSLFFGFGLILMPIAMIERFITGGWLSWRRYITIYPSVLFLCVVAWTSYPIRCMYDNDFAYMGLPSDDDDFDTLWDRLSTKQKIFDVFYVVVSSVLTTVLFFGSFIYKAIF